MTDRMARLVAAVGVLNKELDEMGLEFAGLVYDPASRRGDGSLEMFSVQNVPDSRADLLLEAFAILKDSDSHKVEEFVRVREMKGVSPA